MIISWIFISRGKMAMCNASSYRYTCKGASK